MKKVTLGFSILAVTALSIAGCGKKEPNVAPEPDTEVQSAIEASWATFVMTDIDQMVHFMGENQLLTHFYLAKPGKGTSTTTRDVAAKQLNMSWYQAHCIDGRFREGTIFVTFNFDPAVKPGVTPNSQYTHEYGFAGRLGLSAYKVDGWLIDEFDPQFPGYIYNELTTNAYNPRVTHLTWKFAGKYKFTHPTDTTKNIIWEGELLKTLTNSTDIKVFPSTVTWSLGIASYSGKVEGKIGSEPFKMLISPTTPLIRDFTCYPDKISSVDVVAVGTNSTVLQQGFEEFHPIKKGIATFTIGEKYPRQIYFGNEGNPDLGGDLCDNEGIVLIKGISYRVNFRK